MNLSTLQALKDLPTNTLKAWSSNANIGLGSAQGAGLKNKALGYLEFFKKRLEHTEENIDVTINIGDSLEAILESSDMPYETFMTYYRTMSTLTKQLNTIDGVGEQMMLKVSDYDWEQTVQTLTIKGTEGIDHVIQINTDAANYGVSVIEGTAEGFLDAVNSMTQVASESIQSNAFVMDTLTSIVNGGEYLGSIITTRLSDSNDTVRNIATAISSSTSALVPDTVMAFFQDSIFNLSRLAQDTDENAEFLSPSDIRLFKTTNILTGIFDVVTTAFSFVPTICMLTGNAVVMAIGAAAYGVMTLVTGLSNYVQSKTEITYGDGSNYYFSNPTIIIGRANPHDDVEGSNLRPAERLGCIVLQYGTIFWSPLREDERYTMYVIFINIAQGISTDSHHYYGSERPLYYDNQNTPDSLNQGSYHHFCSFTDAEEPQVFFKHWSKNDWIDYGVGAVQDIGKVYDYNIGPQAQVLYTPEVWLADKELFQAIACWQNNAAYMLLMIWRHIKADSVFGTWVQTFFSTSAHNSGFRYPGLYRSMVNICMPNDKYLRAFPSYSEYTSDSTHGVIHLDEWSTPDSSWTSFNHYSSGVFDCRSDADASDVAGTFAGDMFRFLNGFSVFKNDTHGYPFWNLAGYSLDSVCTYLSTILSSVCRAMSPNNKFTWDSSSPASESNPELPTPFGYFVSSLILPTTFALTPPSIDRRALVAALAGITVVITAAVATTLTVKYKVSRWKMKKTVEWENKAIAASENYKNDPTNKNFQAYYKAQRKFQRYANMTGYASNSLGTFQRAGSATVNANTTEGLSKKISSLTSKYGASQSQIDDPSPTDIISLGDIMHLLKPFN